MVVVADDPSGSGPVLDLLGVEADLTLDHASTRADRAERTARILTGLARALAKLRPDLLLTTGEGPTGVATLVAAAELDLSVATVTGGWPSARGARGADAFHRRVAMVGSRLIAVPDGQTARGWIQCGADPRRMVVTGSPVADAVRRVRRTSIEPIRPLPHPGPVVMLALARVPGAAERDGASRAVAELVAGHPDLEVVCTLPRFDDDAATLRRALEGVPRVRLFPSLDYPRFLDLLDRAELVITDAEGVIEEAAVLGTPILVTAAGTARRSILDAGAGRVVGADGGRIRAEASLLLTDPAHARSMREAWTAFREEGAAARVADAVLATLGVAGDLVDPALVPDRRVA
jgi:UDP-N-acetylglucosamine 2-epimerase (non-hydrolysing)